PDLESPLDVGDRNLAFARDDLDRLVEQIFRPLPTHLAAETVLCVVVHLFRHGIEVFGLALGFQEANHILNLGIRDKWSVYAANASTGHHVEHVALPQTLLSALLSQYGPRVDFCGDL